MSVAIRHQKLGVKRQFRQVFANRWTHSRLSCRVAVTIDEAGREELLTTFYGRALVLLVAEATLRELDVLVAVARTVSALKSVCVHSLSTLLRCAETAPHYRRNSYP